MPLSNAQYDEIMHEYDERQLHNRHILETRRAEVLKKLPRLKEIDASVASSSVRQARLHLDGDTHALASLKQELSALSLERQQLLECDFLTAGQHGLGADVGHQLSVEQGLEKQLVFLFEMFLSMESDQTQVYFAFEAVFHCLFRALLTDADGDIGEDTAVV